MLLEIFVEDTAVAWAEIQLQGERYLEFVFHAEEAVQAAFGIVVARLLPIFDIGVVFPAISDASAASHKAV